MPTASVAAAPSVQPKTQLQQVLAIHPPTMRGTADEELGMDRHLKFNTSNTRTRPIFRQGCMLCELIPNMP